jgi:hypothetical protein
MNTKEQVKNCGYRTTLGMMQFYSSQLLRSFTASAVKGTVGMVVLHGDPS